MVLAQKNISDIASDTLLLQLFKYAQKEGCEYSKHSVTDWT
jgi:hypothetical protein